MKRAAIEGTLPEGMRIPLRHVVPYLADGGVSGRPADHEDVSGNAFPATSGNAAFVEKAAPGNFRYFSINLIFCNSPSAWPGIMCADAC
ncbi:hypothetical protein [Komagataeibacter europaeus]|uniref:hypothetical protein n=1 Tax=Komagataeibacter europaeus TaxID=33995 RepID=UPI00138AF1E0|nr:hypothetical protein [Komagataeibacter europaeus]